jgi:hypothetical protein
VTKHLKWTCHSRLIGRGPVRHEDTQLGQCSGMTPDARGLRAGCA